MIKQCINVGGGQYDRQYTVLKTVIEKDIRVTSGNHGSDTEIAQRPDGMLSGRSAAEVLTRQQHFAFPVGLLVKNEVRIQRPVTAILARLTLVKIPPSIKQVIAKT